MNNTKRKKLQKAVDHLNSALDIVTDIADAEDDSFSNLPEQFLNTKNADKMEFVIDKLDEARDSIEAAISSVEEACE